MEPFCGCGTTIEACEKLGREWIGIDVAPDAVGIIRERLFSVLGVDVDAEGWPSDLAGAKLLAKEDKIGFQRWAVSRAGGRMPLGRAYQGGADGGIDGEIVFDDDGRKGRAVISVKGGGVGVNDIRVLASVMNETGAHLGFFLTMRKPTKGMLNLARDSGFHTGSDGREYRRIQIVTAEQLLSRRPPLEHPGNNMTPMSERPGPHKGQMALPLGVAKTRAGERSAQKRKTASR